MTVTKTRSCSLNLRSERVFFECSDRENSTGTTLTSIPCRMTMSAFGWCLYEEDAPLWQPSIDDRLFSLKRQNLGIFYGFTYIPKGSQGDIPKFYG